MVIGSLISGSLVAYGRRKMLILFGIIGMVFTALTLVPNLVCILIGRCVFGIATGVFMTAAPRMLDETVPQHLIGSFGVYTNVYANLGVMGTLLLGIGLP
jgi:MFS family permease